MNWGSFRAASKSVEESGKDRVYDESWSVNIPDEVLLRILWYLSRRELANVAAVCQLWYVLGVDPPIR